MVRIARHDSADALAATRARPAAAEARGAVEAAVAKLLVAPATELVLRPTSRSALR